MNTKYVVWLAVVALMVLAALPRFYELGSPGFYGDEELTALVSRSVSAGGPANMPSGMPYHRAITHTYMNAVSARLLGSDEELSYRVPAAIFGTLTVPMLFLLARPLVGSPAALLAAVLLAVSEWHIATSREARMYAPFLLFYIAALFSIWRWAVQGGNLRLVTAAAFFLATISFHILGVIGAVLALVPLAFRGWMAKSPAALFGAAATAVVMAWMYNKLISLPFAAWNAAHAKGTAVGEHFSYVSGLIPIYNSTLSIVEMLAISAGAAGAIIGFLIARRAIVQDDASGARIRLIARGTTAVMAGVFTATGYLHGAALGWFVFLALYPHGLMTLLRTAKMLWIALFGLALISIAVICAQLGIVTGIKKLLTFPFPYSVRFLEMLGGVFVLFAAAAFYMVLRPLNERTRSLRAMALAVVLPLFGIGVVSRWEGMRYLIEVYPFILLIAAMALLAALEWAGRRIGVWGSRAVLPIGIVLALSGVLGGHGLPQALRTAMVHTGDTVNEQTFEVTVYPDHQGPGRFIAQHLRPHDLVVAEDFTEPYWYAGRVDYGLRNLDTYGSFFYRAPDGQFRDIYVNSVGLGERELRQLQNERKRRIWIITSRETRHAGNIKHLSIGQAAWIDYISRSQIPVFVGRDDITEVYCLNCDGGL